MSDSINSITVEEEGNESPLWAIIPNFDSIMLSSFNQDHLTSHDSNTFFFGRAELFFLVCLFLLFSLCHQVFSGVKNKPVNKEI